MTPSVPEALAVALQVLDALERRKIAYHVGGSFASSIHGVPRHTNDVDLVVDLALEDVAALATELSDDFYLDEETMRRAVRTRGSCNLLHLGSGVKIDLFVVGDSPFDRTELRRSISTALPSAGRVISVKSAEDTVLRKLLWYRMGGETSDRQWGDLTGIVAVQGETLDRDYLRQWAEELGVSELMERLIGSG